MSYPAHEHSVDWLFAQLPGRSTSPPSLLSELGAAPPATNAAAPGIVWPQPPPKIEDPSDLQAAYEWLQNEKQRLEQYTRSQFQMIEEQHQAMLAKHFRSEQTLALRSQELNREMQFLASQTETLQRRSGELAEREAAFTEHMEKLARAQDDLLALERTSENIRQDSQAQRDLLENLRSETALLQATDSVAQASFNAFEVELKQRQVTWEKKQAEITARQAQMEKRYQALEQAEEAARRRLAEVDDLEDQIRRELEQQEGRLSVERRELELLRAGLRAQVSGRRECTGGIAPVLGTHRRS